MIYILDIILIAVSLSMDAFALSFSYGISKVNIKKIILTAIVVGTFHFIMPLLGNFVGIPLFKYTLIKPKIIVLLGSTALKNILGKEYGITSARGKWIEKKGILYMPTWHPAALLRDETKKIEFWKDLKQVVEKYNEIK